LLISSGPKGGGELNIEGGHYARGSSSLLIYSQQKNNPLQQDCGIHLSFHGASDDALTAGFLLGFSTHLRSVFNHKKERATKSTSRTQAMVESAIKVQYQ